jgi:DNA-binding MarR family transcriptional regulator
MVMDENNPANAENTTSVPHSEAEITKKARKAELKAAEKAEKAEKKSARQAEKAAEKAAKAAEKQAEKALRKIEKQKRKEVEATSATANAPSDIASEKPADGKMKKAKPAAKKQKHEQSKKTHAGSPGMALGAKLQAVARLTRSNLAASLLKHGLYAGQEQVLFLLDEHGPLSLAELAEKLDVRAPTITKTVTRMENQGFLSRAVSRDDARSIIIALTPEGRRGLKIGRQIVHDSEAALFSSLEGADRENFDKGLNLILSHMKSQ